MHLKFDITVVDKRKYAVFTKDMFEDLYLFQIPSDPYKGLSSHTTGYRKHNFSLQNVPFTKEQVSGHSLYIQTYLYSCR
jgi:hypothetical protein